MRHLRGPQHGDKPKSAQNKSNAHTSADTHFCHGDRHQDWDLGDTAASLRQDLKPKQHRPKPILFAHVVARIWISLPVIEWLAARTTTSCRQVVDGSGVVAVGSSSSAARMEALHGRLWESGVVEDMELYLKIRKVEPLEEAMHRLQVSPPWLIGRSHQVRECESHRSPKPRNGRFDWPPLCAVGHS